MVGIRFVPERVILYGVAMLIIAASIGIGYLLRRFLFGALRRLARRTSTRADDAFIVTVRGPFVLWCACAGIYAATRIALLPAEVTKVTDKVLLVLVIGSVTLALAQLALNLIRQSGASRGSAVAYVGLTQTTVRASIIVIGALVLLNSLGISITPMLTALGIGGLAVALALQNTLANTFAGIYITLSRHIRPGDYVRLENGPEGIVTDITWRATTIRTIRNNIVIVPNDKLAQSIVTNYHLREERHRLDIPVGVSYSSDPEHVEAVLVDETRKAIGVVPNLLDEPAPYVLFMPGFGGYSLDFTLVVHVRSYTDQFDVQHRLRKFIFARFRAEGIEIPFPIRTVHLRQE
ncbi:mechanosensitive ion channel [candidate division WOR-3 bacterium]|nr:mechanosensitive ion channel [candidate division WOR-3 bacterium]